METWYQIIDLKPLPSEFFDDWNIIYQKWISLKTIIANNIIKPNEKIMNSEQSIDKVKETSLWNRSIIFSRFIKCIGYKIRWLFKKYFRVFNGSAKNLYNFKYCSCCCFALPCYEDIKTNICSNYCNVWSK